MILLQKQLRSWLPHACIKHLVQWDEEVCTQNGQQPERLEANQLELATVFDSPVVPVLQSTPWTSSHKSEHVQRDQNKTTGPLDSDDDNGKKATLSNEVVLACKPTRRGVICRAPKQYVSQQHDICTTVTTGRETKDGSGTGDGSSCSARCMEYMVCQCRGSKGNRMESSERDHSSQAGSSIWDTARQPADRDGAGIIRESFHALIDSLGEMDRSGYQFATENKIELLCGTLAERLGQVDTVENMYSKDPTWYFWCFFGCSHK